MLSAEPVRVSDVEQFDRPDPQGSACLYAVKSQSGGEPGLVAVGVLLDGTTVLEAGLGASFSEQGVAGLGGNDHAEQSKSRWDWTRDVPGGVLSAARQGHVAIITNVPAWGVADERVDSLAAAIIDRIPDLPFREGSVAVRNSNPDPCALLTQTEAEAILGKLVVAPYRSRESTP
ncbi:MAG: hypothetical protein ACRENP_14155, partial [Longimicrobiales bacterium]